MSTGEGFLVGFDPLPEGFTLPERVQADYEVESCLSEKEGRVVLRLRRRRDGGQYIIKASPEGTEDLAEEYRIMERLSPLLRGAVPEPVDYFKECGKEYILRSYLSGETLTRYRERMEGCTVEECVRIGRELCGLLETLHSQDPPVIHRDIKPENIILLPGGGAGLIDFGIARQYKAGQDTDTRHMGTRSTAAPEQYGYAQTDGRTDLYALGMTLIWLLTGSYDRESLPEDVPPRLKRALKKAVAFAPEDRYSSASELSLALEEWRAGRRKRGVPVLAVILLCLLSFIAGLAVPRQEKTEAPAGQAEGPIEDREDEVQAAPASPEVEFTSMSMEAAVRQALNRPEGAITYDDLSRIRRLAVVGRVAFGAEQLYDYRIGSYLNHVYQQEEPWGDIMDSDLTLLDHMPELRELYLCRQNIRDISCLSGRELMTLALSENSIEDMTPLSGVTGLETLYIGGNPATDYSALAGLTGLRVLILENRGTWGTMEIDSLDFLNGLTLQELGLGLISPKDGDWGPLTTQYALNKLFFWNLPTAAVEAVSTLPDLRELTVCEWYGADMRMLAGLTGLELLGLHGGNIKSLEGIEGMTHLRILAVGHNQVEDLTPLAGLEKLNNIRLESLPVTDFTVLGQLPELGDVWVDADQEEAVKRDCPGYGFRLTTG